MNRKSRTRREDVIAMDGIGPVRVSWRQGLRSMRISLRPFDTVHLSLPIHLNMDEGKKFLIRKKEWIRKTRKKILITEGRRSFFDESSVFRTAHHSLKIIKGDYRSLFSFVKDGVIMVGIPSVMAMSEPVIQEVIRQAIVRALWMEAREYLPGRVAELAQRYKFRPGIVTLRNNRTRWGSCNTKGDISLNIHLMRLPSRIADYVILHELVHTVFPHHQSAFWNMLTDICSEARILERELKQYHTQIF